jgi:hypothetical protein
MCTGTNDRQCSSMAAFIDFGLSLPYGYYLKSGPDADKLDTGMTEKNGDE